MEHTLFMVGGWPMKYDRILQDSIDREKKGIDYLYNENDKAVLLQMLDDINKTYGTNLRFLAEIDYFYIPGSGTIMAQFLDKFQSESIRGYLIPTIVSDNIKNCAQIVLQSYLRFKCSKEYISEPNQPSPAHIYVRYDNALKKLKPKEYKEDLLLLAQNPRDVFYLPFTMRMLASWKIPELEQILVSYLDDSYVTNESLGLPQQNENYYPSAAFIKRELKFTAINCLKYYPSNFVITKLKAYTEIEDKDIQLAVNKTIHSFKRIDT